MRPAVARTGVLLLTLLCVPLIAGLYGILHDQLTYTISEEYYTRFKFIQFGMWHAAPPALLDNPRLHVCTVGFLATWWTGIFIGPIIAFTGLIHKDAKVMLHANFRAVLLTMGVTILTGLTGLLYGWLVLVDKGVSWRLPEGLIDKDHFIMVGSMHNFSYLGGMLGLIAAVIYHVIVKRKRNPEFPKNGLNLFR